MQRQRADIRLRGAFVEWQVRTLGMVLAGLSQSEKQFAALMKFVDGLSMFPGTGLDVPARPSEPKGYTEDDIEEIMSGRYAEAHAKVARVEQVGQMLGRGFIQ